MDPRELSLVELKSLAKKLEGPTGILVGALIAAYEDRINQAVAQMTQGLGESTDREPDPRQEADEEPDEGGICPRCNGIRIRHGVSYSLDRLSCLCGIHIEGQSNER